MKSALISLIALFALFQERPWTPFNDPDNRRHPERVSKIDVGHYKISVRLDDRIPPPLVEGRVEIDLSLTASTGTIDLDAEEMTITEVLSKGKPLEFTHTGGNLAINLGRTGDAGEKMLLDIAYTAQPTSGMFFISPDPERPNKAWQVWTQGETEYNHHWFPCYDYPNDRATSEVIVSVREKYRTVSNGALVKSETKNGWRTEHWKLDIPHVAYLTSIAAGEFDVVEEGGPLPIRYFVPKGWHTEEEIRHTFSGTPAMMKFFGDATGVAYPYPKYDQVVVDDFTWGGMENVTATTLHPGTVVRKRSWADRDSEGLIAHELAHQWFGDLVTCRTWAHAWLNEGFATYMETLWQEKARGREAMIADLDEGLDWYLSETKDEYTRPTACEHYTTPDDVFDAHIYPKGAWILHMLHSQLGTEAWWKGVKHYLTKHRAGVVTTDDFRVAMEEATGKDLKKFFDQWVGKAGHPALRAQASWNEATKELILEINQTQDARKLVWKDLETGVPHFEFPLDVEIETKAGRKTHRIDLTRGVISKFTLDSEPLIIDIDKEWSVLKTLEFIGRSTAQLAYQLQNDDQPWHRWWAAKQLAGKPEGVAALEHALMKDTSTRVRILAAQSLKETSGDESCAALKRALKVDHARVRRAVIAALANHAKSAGPELEKAFKEDPSPACRAAAAESLGHRGGPSPIFAVPEVAKYKDDEVVMPGLLAGMLAASSPAFIDTCLQATQRSVHPVIRLKATECLGQYLAGERDGAGTKRLIELFADSNFRVRTAAVRKAGGVKDAQLASALEKRLPHEPEKRLAKEIRDAIRKIREKKP